MNWAQFRAILWLRWRLSRNQMMKGGGIGAVIFALVVCVLITVGLGLGIGGTLVGALALKSVTVESMMLVWDGVTLGVLFFSLMGVLTEVQRSESIDLARLLHLPISLRQVFVFNFLISLVSVGSVAGMAVMIGLSLGLTISRGLLLALMVPLVLAFSFMVTAWLYCLRGWLVSLMVNQRKRRTVVMWITLSIVLVAQSPNLINIYFQKRARAEREARRAAKTQTATNATPREISGSSETELGRQLLDANAGAKEKWSRFVEVATSAHPWVPVLWLANGAKGLAAGWVWPALWGAAGMAVIGWAGLLRSYRATLRFYRAEGQSSVRKAKSIAEVKSRPTRNWVEWRLPWVPDDAAGLALAQMRSMVRAPEVRMALGMGLFLPILIPLMMLWGAGTRLPEAGKPFFGTGVVVLVMFMSLQFACNQFGYDRDGFRGLVLLPTPRSRILLGKNLALLPVFIVITVLPLTAVSVFANLPLLAALASLVQFGGAFFIVSIVGSLCSILLPYRIAIGSLNPTKSNWRSVLGMMAIMLVFPMAISPIFVPPALGWAAERWLNLSAGLVNLGVSTILTVALLALYSALIKPLGRLLQSREGNVLRSVTEGAE